MLEPQVGRQSKPCQDLHLPKRVITAVEHDLNQPTQSLRLARRTTDSESVELPILADGLFPCDRGFCLSGDWFATRRRRPSPFATHGWRVAISASHLLVSKRRNLDDPTGKDRQLSGDKWSLAHRNGCLTNRNALFEATPFRREIYGLTLGGNMMH